MEHSEIGHGPHNSYEMGVTTLGCKYDFFNGDLKEDIFMMKPKGFEVKG
jgi:hypothetical protein